MQLADIENEIVIKALQRGEIHVWKANIHDDIVEKKCLQVLSDTELKKASFFKFEEAEKQFVVNQGMIRILIGAYLDKDPADVQIGRRPKGKPYSLDDSGLFFNTSNSGGLCVFACSRDGEIGVDIEKIRSLPDLEDLIEMNFTALEKKYIRRVEEKVENRFFRFWTIKESYLKAIGEGMRLTPDNLEFSINKESFKLLSKSGVFDFDDWMIQEFVPQDDFVGTLVYGNSDSRIEQNWFSLT